MPLPTPPIAKLPRRWPGGLELGLVLGLALLGLALLGLAIWQGLGTLALVATSLAGVLALSGVACGALLTRWRLRAELHQLLGDRPAACGLLAGELSATASAARPTLLAPVAETLQSLLRRQQALFDAQAEQLELLRRQADSDALTGLFNRRHFSALLDGLLCGDEQPINVGLLLLRVRDLQGLNQRLGRVVADKLLISLAQLLLPYIAGIARCSAGRIDGGDFVLLLPVGGMADETAATLAQALLQPFARIDALAGVDIGVVELNLPTNAAQALAQAEAALGRHGPAARMRLPAEHPSADRAPFMLGDVGPSVQSSWQRCIARALVKGHVTLAAFPVCTPDGRQLHLDCPLRVRLHALGPLETAARWLPLASQNRMCAALDERAVQLALQAIARDGQARCINLATQSLESEVFVAAVTRRLAAASQAACRLWIDLPEALALAQPSRVREVSRQWRPLGVMLALEHAGEALARIPQLTNLGLDCVRIDSRFVNGLTGVDAAAARLHLQGLVKLVQAVGLQVTAEGVRGAEDLDQLWKLGFDAATGPALRPEAAAAETAAVNVKGNAEQVPHGSGIHQLDGLRRCKSSP